MKWRSVSRKTRTILKKAKKGWIKKLITRVGYVKEVKEEPVLEKKETSKKSSKYLKEGLMVTLLGIILLIALCFIYRNKKIDVHLIETKLSLRNK